MHGEAEISISKEDTSVTDALRDRVGRKLNDEAVMALAADAYAYKAFTDRQRVIEVPARYWLAAVPAIILCIVLLVACPNPVVM